MGRKSSPFEDIVETCAALPWQVGVVLAAISYFLLHRFALIPGGAPAIDLQRPGGAASVLGGTLAYYLQYIVSGACLLGALVSAIKRRRRRALHAQLAGAPTRTSLDRLSWREFELVVGEYFRRKGFEVEERGGAGPDGGVDLVLRLGRDRYLVQCKQWKSRSVGVAVVRELFGVMAAEEAVGGFVVSSGSFTDEARRFAEGRAIELVDAPRFLAGIAADGLADGRSRPGPAQVPDCPDCGSPMVQRQARRGTTVGQRFWGCSRFPSCRGSRPA